MSDGNLHIIKDGKMTTTNEVKAAEEKKEQNNLNERLNYKFQQYVEIQGIKVIGKEYVAMRDCFKAGYLFKEKEYNYQNKETEKNGIQI